MSNIVEKPWGSENRWAVNDRYLGKLLHINPGHKLSLQYHEKKDESIYVLKGNLNLHIGDKESQEILQLGEGDSYRIKPGMVHRFEAPQGNAEEVVLIEVSTPEIEDVVRLSDDYNRV